jgi:hypothetical protein
MIYFCLDVNSPPCFLLPALREQPLEPLDAHGRGPLHALQLGPRGLAPGSPTAGTPLLRQ